MARRVGTWSVCLVGSLALAVSLTGCYEHHTADEELLDIPFPADAYPVDSGVHKADAGANKCGTDIVSQLLCGLTGGGTGTTSTGNGSSSNPLDLGSLLTGLGLGGTGGTGGTGTSGGTNTGTGNIADLLGSLFGGTGGTGATGGGRPVTGTATDAGAGTVQRMVDAGGRVGFTMPTPQECANPADQITRFLCGLQQNGVTDAGAGATLFVQ